MFCVCVCRCVVVCRASRLLLHFVGYLVKESFRSIHCLPTRQCGKTEKLLFECKHCLNCWWALVKPISRLIKCYGTQVQISTYYCRQTWQTIVLLQHVRPRFKDDWCSLCSGSSSIQMPDFARLGSGKLKFIARVFNPMVDTFLIAPLRSDSLPVQQLSPGRNTIISP